MSTLWIRVKRDGYLFPYDEILAQRSDCEVIPEEVAFPEKFITPAVQEAIERHTTEKKPRGRAKKAAPLDLATGDIPEAPQYTAPELSADASRGLP